MALAAWVLRTCGEHGHQLPTCRVSETLRAPQLVPARDPCSSSSNACYGLEPPRLSLTCISLALLPTGVLGKPANRARFSPKSCENEWLKIARNYPGLLLPWEGRAGEGCQAGHSGYISSVSRAPWEKAEDSAPWPGNQASRALAVGPLRPEGWVEETLQALCPESPRQKTHSPQKSAWVLPDGLSRGLHLSTPSLQKGSPGPELGSAESKVGLAAPPLCPCPSAPCSGGVGPSWIPTPQYDLGFDTSQGRKRLAWLKVPCQGASSFSAWCSPPQLPSGPLHLRFPHQARLALGRGGELGADGGPGSRLQQEGLKSGAGGTSKGQGLQLLESRAAFPPPPALPAPGLPLSPGVGGGWGPMGQGHTEGVHSGP